MLGESIIFNSFYTCSVYNLNYEEDDFNEIVWEEDKNGTQQIRSSSILNLIVHITDPKKDNLYDTITIIRTFASFTTPKEFFQKLCNRFNYIPKGLLNMEFSKELSMIRLKIINVLKIWIEKYYFDDFDTELKSELHQFIQDIKKIHKGPELSIIIETVVAKKELETKPLKYELVLNDKDLTKEAIDRFILTEPTKIAQQLALIACESFSMITKNELLNENWTRDKRKNTFGLKNCVSTFNNISMLVGTIILSFQPLELPKIIEKFIDIADGSLQLNDFQSLFTIVSGLSLASIYRLKTAWGDVKPEYIEKYKYLNQIVSREAGFKGYKRAWEKASSPRIPYIGLALTDLTFIQDGNPHLIDNKINFVKRKCFSFVINSIEVEQVNKYQFEKDIFLQDFLLHFITFSEEEMFKKSLTLSPKKKSSLSIFKYLQQ